MQPLVPNPTTGALVVDQTRDDVFLVALTRDVTSVSFVNAEGRAGQRLELHLVQDSSGARQVNGWPITVSFAAGLTLTAASYARDVIVFRQITNPVDPGGVSYGEIGRATGAAVSTVLSVNGRFGNVVGLAEAVDLAGKQVALNLTAVQTGAYTAAPFDYVLADVSASGWTITLPTAPVDKTRIGWKIVAQAATPNTLTVACGGSDRFTNSTGPTSLSDTLSGQAAIAQYQASTGLWIVQSDDIPLGQLDNRYAGKALWAAKGALVSATGAGALVDVPIGLNGQVPTADNTQTAGWSWQTPAAGGSGGSGISSVTAADASITIAGTAYAPTFAVGAVPESRVTNLVTDLAAKSPVLFPTATQTSAYTASASDYVMCNLSGGAFTITLPSAPADRTRIGWKIAVQAATPNTLTVAASGTDRFTNSTGPGTVTALLAGQGGIAQYQASTGVWVIQAADLPLSGLDSRYLLAGSYTPPDATTTSKGVVELAGDLAGTALAPTVPALATKVPLTQRGPLGGVQVYSYAATVTPDATAGTHFAVVATGNLVVAAPTGGVDGQRLLVEMVASGASRTLGISGTTTNASGATLPVTAATSKTAWLGMVYSGRAGHWVVLAAAVEA